MSQSPQRGLDVERWGRARAIFDALADLGPDAQEAGLRDACGGDRALAVEVASLLAHDRSADETLTRLVADAARAAVGADGPAGHAPVPSSIGRYRVVDRLGEGGMGEVFLAEDMTLGRRVALKRPPALLASDPDARGRLLREARAAATLNHPHVCIVHEVGEDADGRPFIAMEHLEGETLAARLTRGRLPIAQVVALGREAAAALDAAHAQGVIHRDIKPSNIMRTPHGAKLLDFGLASLALDPWLEANAGGFMGTVRYMSPEQARGEPVDRRTDLFSLGVVLYEAATGCRPFDGPTPLAARAATLRGLPRPPSRLVPGLPKGFDRLIARLLAVDRDERCQQAAELVLDLGRLPTVPHRAVPPARTWLVASAALLLALALGWWRFWPAAPPPARTVFLVADLLNTTGDPDFDDALREALKVQLRQTPFLGVFPEAGVRETLRLMARPPGEPLTPRIAREIAMRRGLPAWIGGAIAPRGRGYRITLAATSSQTGAILAEASAEAGDRGQVLPVLGTVVMELRRTLGESRLTLQQFSTPIEHATTASLDALKAYALGIEQANRGDYATAVSLFQRAVQIDPEFAIAHQALGREELNSSYSERVVAAATRAHDLRARVSKQEQARIVVFFHRSVTGNLDRAIAAASRWQRTYPTEWWPFHALADLYFSVGAYPLAVESAREAVRLNPDVAAAYSNLAGGLFALDRFTEAQAVYALARARGFDAPEYHGFLWRIAYYGGDEAAMRRELEWAASSSTWAYNMPALAAALQGQWREAREWSARSRALFESRNQVGLMHMAVRYEVVTAALVGDCAAVRGPLARSFRGSLVEDQAQVLLALALCGDREGVLRSAEALESRRPSDTRLARVWLPAIRAAVAIRHGDGRGAIERLQVSSAYEGAADSWPTYLRGLARLQAGAPGEARADFERILARRGQTFWMPIVPLAHLGRARAATLSGDVATASSAFEDLFATWKDADPDLPVLVEARREYAALAARP